MWNKLRNWIRKNILTEDEVITNVSTLDINVFKDYKDNQDIRQTYLLEKLKEFEEAQNGRFRAITDKLTSIELLLNNSYALLKKQDDHLNDKKDLRYLDELNFKLRKNNDYKHEFEQKLSVSENNKKKALLERERKKIAQQKEKEEADRVLAEKKKEEDKFIPYHERMSQVEDVIDESKKSTNPNVLSKAEWRKMRKGDQKEFLLELSLEERIEQLEEVNPFLGGSNNKRGREWIEQQLDEVNPATSFRGVM